MIYANIQHHGRIFQTLSEKQKSDTQMQNILNIKDVMHMYKSRTRPSIPHIVKQ